MRPPSRAEGLITHKTKFQDQDIKRCVNFHFTMCIFMYQLMIWRKGRHLLLPWHVVMRSARGPALVAMSAHRVF